MERISDEDLAALEKLCAEAMPGPWTTDSDTPRFVRGPSGVGVARIVSYQPYPATARAKAEHAANGAFIAAARTALPELLQALRRLRGQP